MMRGMAAPPPRKPDTFADTRMTIGQHLDELRSCLMRSLLAFVVACLICIWPAKYLLALIARPVMLALRAHDQQDSFLQTSPVEGILVYIKVVIVFGLIISAPYIIYQVWNFIAVGLYKHEQKWVYRLVPLSVGLFLTGVVFMYLFALLLALNFLVGFSGWLSLPRFEPTRVEQMLLGKGGGDEAATQPAVDALPQIAVLWHDPELDANNPPVGRMWFNSFENKLKVVGRDHVYSYQLQRDDRHAMLTTHFKIGEYLTFVLVLTVAFGLAFQMPLVVVFLVRTGIVPIETFRRYRRVVILIIVIIAGMIAPPDLFSHLILSGPMIILFEVGLLFARRGPKGRSAA